MIPTDNQPRDQKEKPQTGSPLQGEPVFLLVGLLRRTHGVKGDLLMEIKTDFPERIKPHKMLYVGDQHEALTVRSVRKAHTHLIISFEGFHNPEDSARLRNLPVYVKVSELPKLPEGEFYHHELLGLGVISEDGQNVGTLIEILETGANDVFIIRQENGNELLIPAIESVVLEILPDQALIRVRIPEWE